jgi:epoxyqueuosine reductase QueG
MSDRVLTDKLRAEILGMGMDLVGFGPVDRWSEAPFLLSPKAILPECKTVVVAAIHITDTWTEMGGEPEPQDRSAGGWMDQNSLLDRVAYRTVRLLNDQGQKAIAVASSNIWRYRQFEGIPSLFAPDLSHIHAAAAAGLAEIGWSGLAITPEFGSRCRFISIVTDAELVPTPMYNGPKLCDMCGECIKHCPTASLRKELGKPHEVKIGGRVFRYANKNMWRCAWAEHFNLDLNSQHLKEWPKIGEAEILREKAEKGERGHERGVCQKYCVPPHLRTNMPSFGRRDKLIAQNRINRRYPDSMPTLRKIRDDITAAAIRMGADLCAVAPLAHDIQTEPGYTLLREIPGAKTVIAMAMRVPPGNEKGIAFTLMHHICLKIARMTEDYGYAAASYNDAKELAEMAGLGRRAGGSPEKFLSPEFGEDVAVAAVVTHAPLDPSPAADRPATPAAPRKLAAKELRGRLENVAETSLVSLFGVSPAERLEKAAADLEKKFRDTDLGEAVWDSNPNYHGVFVPKIERPGARIKAPSDWLPDAKSVIVAGMHFPDEIVKNAGDKERQQIGPYAFWQYQTRNELAFAALALARELQRQGFKAVITTDMFGAGSLVASHRGMVPDARCNAIEAVAAGLGELGENGALLTPEHGAHQRLIAVVTNAELPADALYSGKALCKKCGACRTACPMKAFKKTSFKVHLGKTVLEVPEFGRLRCDWSKRYALCKEEGPAMIGNKTDVPFPEGEITIDAIAEACKGRDPVMKSRPCILESCLKFCRAAANE